MIYEVLLRSRRTFWWDEDESGSCQFSASSDDDARGMVATVVLRINREYERINESRDVYVSNLVQVVEEAGLIKRRGIEISELMPFSKLADIRRTLNIFFPLSPDKSRFRGSLLRGYCRWKELPQPEQVRDLTRTILGEHLTVSG